MQLAAQPEKGFVLPRTEEAQFKYVCDTEVRNIFPLQ